MSQLEWENESEIIEEMSRAHYRFADIARVKFWMKDAPTILSGLGLANFDDQSSSGSFVCTSKWQLVTRGLMLTVSNPAGRAIREYEERIPDLEDGFDFHPIEVHGLAGAPLPINFLFVHRDSEVLKLVTTREAKGELVILNPGRLPQLRICGPGELGAPAIVEKLLTASRLDTRDWNVFVIDLSSSWSSAIVAGSPRVEIVTKRDRAWELIECLHRDMFHRTQSERPNTVEGYTETKSRILLVINALGSLLESEAQDENLSSKTLSSRKQLEEFIYNLARRQDVGIYVIADVPDSQSNNEIDVSLDEALQCLGLLQLHK